MMKIASAFSPSHITGFFQIRENDSSGQTGSRGAGISLSRGITTSVCPGKETLIRINGKIDPAPVSLRLIELFCRETGMTFSGVVDHSIAVPEGRGFGTSGAGVLSLAFALNKAMDFPLEEKLLISLAHRSEIDSRTGLGTVMGEAYGGMEIREEGGDPYFGRLSYILPGDYCRVLCLVFGRISTVTSLGDEKLRKQINLYGGELVDRIIKKPEPLLFMEMARDFSYKTGMVPPHLSKAIEELDKKGYIASMLMFGEGIFLLSLPEEEERVASILKKYDQVSGKGTLFASSIDMSGVRYL